jgi:hypothetical protein
MSYKNRFMLFFVFMTLTVQQTKADPPGAPGYEGGGSKSSSQSSRDSKESNAQSAAGNKSSSGNSSQSSRDSKESNAQSAAGNKSSSGNSSQSSRDSKESNAQSAAGNKSSSGNSSQSSRDSKESNAQSAAGNKSSSGNSSQSSRDSKESNAQSAAGNKSSSGNSSQSSRDSKESNAQSAAGNKSSSGNSSQSSRDSKESNAQSAAGNKSSSGNSSQSSRDSKESNAQSAAGKTASSGNSSQSSKDPKESNAQSAAGKTSTTSSPSRGIVGTVQEFAKDFATGMQKVAESISKSKAVENINRIAQETAAASSAGYKNMVDNAGGTIGAGSLGYQEALEADYYSGVKQYYDQNKITVGLVPTGPMSRVYGPVAVSKSPQLAAIDEGFRSGSVSVVGNRLGTTEEHMREFLSDEVYDNLTDIQRLGMQESVLVGGDISKGPIGSATNDVLPNNARGAHFVRDIDSIKGTTTFSVPNLVVIDTNLKKYPQMNYDDQFKSTVKHEIQHAGDYKTYEAAKRTLNDPKASVEQKALAKEVIDRLEPVLAKEAYNELIDGTHMTQGQIDNLMDQYNALSEAQKETLAKQLSYFESAIEVRAFAVDELNQANWAQKYSQSTGISVEDAREIMDSVVEDNGINDPNSPENKFAGSQLKGGI